MATQNCPFLEQWYWFSLDLGDFQQNIGLFK